MGYEAFYGCDSLASAALPSTLREVDNEAFSGCRSLTAIDLPASLESVGWSAFRGCAPAAPVALPAALSQLGEGAFEFWRDRDTVWDGDLGEWVDPPAPSYELAPATWAQYWRLSGNARYIDPETTTVVEPNAPQGDVELTYEDNGAGLTVTGCADGFPADLDIPTQHDGRPVTAIGPSAFEDAMWLRSVTVPEGVATLGESAFAGCGALASVELPSTLREIGGSAFEDCSALAAADVPAGADLGDHAFAGCTALARVSLPEGVTAGVRHGEYDY